MAVSKKFIQAWQNWRRNISLCSSNQLSRRSTATSKIACDLDHLDSYLYGIGLTVMDGKDCEYSELARRELSELEKLSSEIEMCDIDENERDIFRQHIGLLQNVWVEIQKLDSNDLLAVSTENYGN